MPVVTLARHAMATRFELVLHGANPSALRAAGEEALEEIERLEARLSLFLPSSEIAHLNARAGYEPVRVTPGLFALLEQARQLSRETQGAFDITVAPLVRCWGFTEGRGRIPSPEELAQARAGVGAHLLELNPKEFTVRFSHAGVRLDLGAIGKGYAIERAADLLREAGVTGALLHGGTSTVYGLGKSPEGQSWQVALEHPRGRTPPAAQRATEPLAIVPLENEAVSVSAVWGRSFEAGGQTFGHVIDPRSGQPVRSALLAAVALPSAVETDALSTALLTAGIAGHDTICGLRPGMRTLVAAAGSPEFRSRGIEVLSSD
jgi:thiamine biosynthesis lipoprotein